VKNAVQIGIGMTYPDTMQEDRNLRGKVVEHRAWQCLDSGGDGDLWACGTHLSTRQTNATAEAIELRKQADIWFNSQGRANVVAGDFNAAPNDPAALTFSRAGYSPYSTVPYVDDVGVVQVTFKASKTLKSTDLSHHIDYVFMAPTVVGDQIGSARSWYPSASDHYQLWGAMHIR
jgi:endonuclease/exonuclease/phosphatase family metal-dependent hydrolase